MAIFQTSRFKITTLDFGTFKLDGGAMFGVVPRTLWARHHPPDELNRIDMALRCLLIETGDRVILVDTGFGEGRPERFREMYAFTGSEDYIDGGLREVGLKRGDITDVFLTHLHFDHVGGATIKNQTTPEPGFPSARYHLQQKQLEQARSRLERDKASYFKEDFEPLLEKGVLELYEGDFSLMPGIDTVIVNGHTPAMQLLRIRDDGKTFVFAADLIPLASQFSLPWIMAYDLFPVTTLEEKKRILPQAASEGWTFIFEHDPKVVSGKVIQTEKGFALSN